ncbi:IclR family transcriptional regulator [Phaeobacter sp. JH20_10]|uniref:IclR family transcriptional regulator n=1 Tax=unclassified Phaeobacter TaxID=2621772 RepID=UPI003A8BBBD4
MKTVDKALTVLDQFSLEHQEVGLTELSQMAGLDKAATRRLLLALSKHGFVEQVAETRKYRLGHGFLRLARIREDTVTMERAAQEVADWLALEVNDTAHVAIPGATGMVTIGYKLPNKGNCINIIRSQVLLYHATASGIAFTAFASEATRKRILGMKRTKESDFTLTSKSELLEKLEQTRANGYSESRNALEIGVASVGMPFFTGGEDPTGTVAVAVPDSNMDAGRMDELLPPLREAVARIEVALTGGAAG